MWALRIIYRRYLLLRLDISERRESRYAEHAVRQNYWVYDEERYQHTRSRMRHLRERMYEWDRKINRVEEDLRGRAR